MYFEDLQNLTKARGNLCVGIDPHPQILKAWDLPQNIQGLERLCRDFIAGIGAEVAVFKPQSAFFEVYGADGIAVLEKVLADINQAGALSILDIKRGDIGSTMSAYAQAYLASEAPLVADAITVSPFLGFNSLAPAYDLARDNGKGIYVLARTSNPEGHEVQLAHPKGLNLEINVAQEIINQAISYNEQAKAGVIGLVVGGTHENLGCDLDKFNASILVPGIGAQGGKISDLPAAFGESYRLALPMVGRAIMGIGKDFPKIRRQIASYLAN